MHHGDVLLVHIHAVWPDVPDAHPLDSPSEHSCSASGSENWGTEQNVTEDDVPEQEEDINAEMEEESQEAAVEQQRQHEPLHFFVWYINHHTYTLCEWPRRIQLSEDDLDWLQRAAGLTSTNHGAHHACQSSIHNQNEPHLVPIELPFI